MEKPFLYFISKMIAAIAAITIFITVDVDITLVVISTLSFACIFVLELLLTNIKKQNKMIRVTIILSIAACFVLGIEMYYFLFIILLMQLLEATVISDMFYYILSVAIVLSYLIFMPDMNVAAITIFFIVLLVFCRIILMKLSEYRKINEEQKETLLETNKKLTDVKSLTKTLKYTASVEERNRIAARIHDQVGHGISGSIILLEASLLIMKDNPEKAAASIQKAITNLREGVDEIRTALKEERTQQYRIGMNEITVMLEEFKVNYNKLVSFKTSGDMDIINLEIWACIYDNAKECLTNVLKHSNASEFILNIEVFKKIIKVEYKDNGCSSENFEKGIGLEAIEERTVIAKGRCFFHKGETGFCVTNIFIY